MSDTNQPILRTFLEIKNKALDIKVNLIADGEIDAANDLSERIRKLDVCIEQLRAQVLDDWLVRVDNLNTEIDRINIDIQSAVDDIADDIDTARKVVKITGYIDDAVVLAGKVLI